MLVHATSHEPKVTCRCSRDCIVYIHIELFFHHKSEFIVGLLLCYRGGTNRHGHTYAVRSAIGTFP